MQTITEQLEDIARGTRVALLAEIQEAVGLTDAEMTEGADNIKWTGRTMQRDGHTFFEYSIPGSWNGFGWAAIVDGLLASIDPTEV